MTSLNPKDSADVAGWLGQHGQAFPVEAVAAPMSPTGAATAPARRRTPRRPGALAKPRQGAPGLMGLAALAAAMKEEELLIRITCGTKREPGICVQLGLTWHHEHDSRRSTEGWPDLVIGRENSAVILVWELKTERGRLTLAQQKWLNILEAAGNQVGVRRPMDLLSGRITRELCAFAGLGGTR